MAALCALIAGTALVRTQLRGPRGKLPGLCWRRLVRAMAGGSGKSAYPGSKWRLELGSRGVGGGGGEWPLPPGLGKTSGEAVAAAGSGGSDSASSADSPASRNQSHLLTKRAWDIALAPVKGLPMNLFMMYMAGSSISIFPIMMVGMMALRPAKALLQVNSSFKALQNNGTGSLILQKLVFVLGNLGGMALATYKCHSMGLLPTHPSDWLDFQRPPERLEWAAGGFAFL